MRIETLCVPEADPAELRLRLGSTRHFDSASEGTYLLTSRKRHHCCRQRSDRRCNACHEGIVRCEILENSRHIFMTGWAGPRRSTRLIVPTLREKILEAKPTGSLCLIFWLSTEVKKRIPFTFARRFQELLALPKNDKHSNGKLFLLRI